MYMFYNFIIIFPNKSISLLCRYIFANWEYSYILLIFVYKFFCVTHDTQPHITHHSLSDTVENKTKNAKTKINGKFKFRLFFYNFIIYTNTLNEMNRNILCNNNWLKRRILLKIIFSHSPLLLMLISNSHRNWNIFFCTFSA